MIPSDATLIFDIEVIKFRFRPPWEKPFMQRPGLSEKPYLFDAKAQSEYQAKLKGLNDAIAGLDRMVKKAKTAKQTKQVRL